MAFVPVVRNAIHAIDKNQPIAEIGTLEESLARSTAMPRFTTSIIGVVSGFALLIAVVGVYGLLAYTVAQRMPELGIRLTLGASPRQVSWLLLRQAMLGVLAGVIGGLVGAWWLARWLESLLFRVRPHDPATFVGGLAGPGVTSRSAGSSSQGNEDRPGHGSACGVMVALALVAHALLRAAFTIVSTLGYFRPQGYVRHVWLRC